ncbi:MAG TPA: transcription termination factor NusA [Candidatus Babeliales bacterium]|nr:transcription termination factor NusA [Candidatus Babeliales bacterium]
MKLADVIDELVEERGLERASLGAVVCEGMLAAYQRKYPDLALKVEEDPVSGDLLVLVQKTVVASVEDEDTEISLKKARNINKDSAVDDTVWVPFEGQIGRVEVLRARQVIASKIKNIEAQVVYDQFKDKRGQIIIGTVHKFERNGISVKFGDVYAFLPYSLSIPGERFAVGYTIRALLKEVLSEPQGDNQLILDRISPEFLEALFALEIPEVFEKLVEIKKIVRAPGYKSKVAVFSHDRNIDPVGTCVGVGGSRIKPILKELNGETIDVFLWSDNVSLFVKNSLKPAAIDRVELSPDNTIARVWLNEDQRPFAIGKGGQNISLASQITGVSIQLVRDEGQKKDKENSDDELSMSEEI